MARRHSSYAWALHLEVADVSVESLSEAAYAGLEYARRLAEEASLRSALNLPRYRPEYEPLTLNELADQEGISVATLNRRITTARRALFGQIGDNAIHRRVQRRRTGQKRSSQRCAQPGCDDPLVGAHGNRRYCDRHRQAAERTRRHRARP